jgi:hypothetical protein
MKKIPKNGRVMSLVRGTDANKELYYARIEWVDDENYRVVGEFRLIGWAAPPRAVGEKMQAALSKPPKVLYHLGPRGRAGSR